jgi:hypothetical protein
MITRSPNAAELLAKAQSVYFSAHVVYWESIHSDADRFSTVEACEDRLLKFAGSASLPDGSIGPAPYAEWSVSVDGETHVCGHWGVDPDVITEGSATSALIASDMARAGKDAPANPDPAIVELEAMRELIHILLPLPPESRARALRWVAAHVEIWNGLTRDAMDVASGDPTDDPGYLAYVDECARVCRCTRDCPCAGVLAGGMCDGFVDEPNDDDLDLDEGQPGDGDHV